MEDEMIIMKSLRVSPVTYPVRILEVFMFEEGEMMALDSYQRIEEPTGWEVQAASRLGDRRAFVIANGQWSREDWMLMSSYDALKGFRADLEKENSSHPLMFGECSFFADGKRTIWVELQNICAEVELRSIRCDFKGKSYEAEGITDLKVYLINVNAQCGLMPEDHVMPERIINMGELNESDLENMEEPGLLFREGEAVKSGESLQCSFRFRCYPNTCPEESPGSPFTRLVIEGKIGGQTYYWPVNIGRQAGNADMGRGIERNKRYVYDVTITGKGSSDPDIPVGSEAIGSKLEVLKWEEKEEYVIGF